MDLMQVDALCKQAMQVKRRGATLEAKQMLEDCAKTCERDHSSDLCFATLYKSQAKLCYIQRDYSTAKAFNFRAVDIFGAYNLQNEVGICLMHLSACSDKLIRSKFHAPYLQSLETGSYAGVSQKTAIGIAELGTESGTNMYDEYSKKKASMSMLCRMLLSSTIKSVSSEWGTIGPQLIRSRWVPRGEVRK